MFSIIFNFYDKLLVSNPTSETYSDKKKVK